MFGKILVGLDGSAGAQRALDAAVALAKATGASLHGLAVAEPPPLLEASIDAPDDVRAQVEAQAAKVADDARRAASALGATIEVETLYGHPAPAIEECAADAGVDLIVVGHAGRAGVLDALLGSTSETVVRHARCSVLVVR